MKLRFNEGAIIEITLYGSAKKTCFFGKVVKVLEDEVQMIPQMRVLKEDNARNWLVFREYEEFYSADVPGEVIHINRQLIRSWRYIKPRDLDSRAVGKEKDTVTGLTVKDCMPLNQYNEKTGYCEGSGKYCGDIEEHYASPVIIAVKKSSDDNDESKLSLEP